MISLGKQIRLQFFFLLTIFLAFLSYAIFTDKIILLTVPFVSLFIFWGWEHPKYIFFILIAALPFSFQYDFSEFLSTDIPDEPIMLFVFFLFLIHYLNKTDTIPASTWNHPLMILLLITLVWLIVSTIFSTVGLISIKYFLAKGWYVGAFVLAPLLFIRNKRNLKISAIIFVASTILTVIIILLRHAVNSFTFASINDAVLPFFRNHVIYAAMLICSVPLIISLYRFSQSKRTRFFLIIILIILLVAIYFSYSRGAWIALLIGGLTYILIKKKFLFVAFIIATFALVTSFLWLKNNDRYLRFAHDYKTTIFHKDFREHLIATYKLKDVSTAERFYRWIAGVRMIKDNWLTGYGPGTFYYNYKPYAIPAYKTWVSKNEDRSTVHNYFLLIAIEQGLPGIIFFLLLAGAILFYAQKLYHRVKDSLYKTIAITAGVICMMLLVVNFLSDLIETDKIGSIFFLCLSLLIITDVNTRNEFKSPDN